MDLLKHIKDHLTHDLLLRYMPFDSGWLDDGTGTPDPASVMAATALSAISVVLVATPPKVHIN